MERRKFLKLVLGASLITTSAPLLAQSNPPGHPPGGGGKNPDDPAIVLPGPFGYLGGGGKIVITKEELGGAAEVGQKVGNWGMGAGGVVTAAGGTTLTIAGSTGVGAVVGGFVAGVGIGMGLGGMAMSGAGIIMEGIADDPPRPDYKRDPDCKIVTVGDLRSLAEVPRELHSYLNSLLRAYATSANCLAALELYGGAQEADDITWMKRHRSNFVTYWNAMLDDMKVVPSEQQEALEFFQQTLKKANLTPKKLHQALKGNQKKVQDEARKVSSQFLSEWERAGNTEVAYVARTLDGFALSDKPLSGLNEMTKSTKHLGRVLEKLPNYK